MRDLAAHNRARGASHLWRRDEERLARFEEALTRYGEHVTFHRVHLPEPVERFVEAMHAQGVSPLLVGGSVRDSFDGRAPKDLDFEMYGAPIEQVAALAEEHGRVDAVGVSFGVLKVTMPDGTDLDLSVPRRDNKIGAGHTGFTVDMDPTLTVEEAAARRDFTINAMSYDPRLGVLIDPHSGQDDLDRGLLRHVSDAFDEDPLRVLRGVQFAARYGHRIHPDTARRCARLAGQEWELARERVRGEWGKFYAKGQHPQAGLQALRDTGWDARFPGLAAINDEALGQVAARANDLTVGDTTRRVPVMAGVVASRMSDDDARRFVSATVEGEKVARKAYALSRPFRLPTSPAEARQAAMEGPVTLRERLLVAQARGEATGRAARFSAGVMDGPEEPWLDGRDLIDAGWAPSPALGEMLGKAGEAQANRVFRNRAGALAWLRKQTPR